LDQRKEAIRRRLEGQEPKAIYRDLGRSKGWFFKWWTRYQDWGPEGLHDLPRVPHTIVNKTNPAIEATILGIRERLEQRDTEETKYSLIGSPSIAREMRQLGYLETEIPPLRTIDRILQRNHQTHPVASIKEEWTRKHYPAPPAVEPNDVQQLDLVGPRYLTGQSTKYYFEVLKDTVGKAVFVDAADNRRSDTIVAFQIAGWQAIGIPKVLQIDNGTEFLGSPRYPKSLSKPIKLCLHLDVEVLFIPPKSPWRNGCIENFNGLLDELLVRTQDLANLEQMRQEARVLTHACNIQHPHPALNYLTAMEYRQQHPVQPLSPGFQLPDWKAPLQKGTISFIRMIRKSGRITILQEKFDITPELKWEYVYASIVIHEQKLKVWHKGELIKTFDYQL
jgi:transposase InsO family protein